jgi:hypothetical protein
VAGAWGTTLRTIVEAERWLSVIYNTATFGV